MHKFRWIFALALCTTLIPATGHAQQNPSLGLRILGNLLSNGGYFPSTAEGRSALGASKFYNEIRWYGRPRHLGSVNISGGAQIMTTSDSLLPFVSNQNEFSLFGGGVRVQTPRTSLRPSPYIGMGMYVGRLRSQKLGFDTTQVIPSGEFGIDFPIGRWVTLTAGYRMSQRIRGVNTDGWILNLRVF
jgi:hypothetical protein